MCPSPATNHAETSSLHWRHGVTTAADTVARRLDVDEPLRALLPGRGLRRGTVVTVSGSRSLLLALLARPSHDGAWCVMAGVEGLGLAAAAEAGVDLDRLVVIPRLGERWPEIVAALVEVFDVVALRAPGPVPPPVDRRLEARVRRHGTVLLVVRDTLGAPVFSSSSLELAVTHSRWEGIGDGDGYLRARQVEIRARDATTPRRPRQIRLRLPLAGVL